MGAPAKAVSGRCSARDAHLRDPLASEDPEDVERQGRGEPPQRRPDHVTPRAPAPRKIGDHADTFWQ
jgi:hypothetical protein